LNRGDYVIAVICTSSQFTLREKLPHCLPFCRGEFGFPKDCVAQCESLTLVERQEIDWDAGRLGVLDAVHPRRLIKALGYIFDSECEPT